MNVPESDSTILFVFVLLFAVLAVAAVAITIEVVRQVGEALERARHPLGDALENYALYMADLDEVERNKNWNAIARLEAMLEKPADYNEQERIQARVRQLLPMLREQRRQAREETERLSAMERHRRTLLRPTNRSEELLRPARNAAIDSDELLRPAGGTIESTGKPGDAALSRLD